jgi:hypothetical protein
MNHGRSCYLTWMRGAIWRAATSLPSQPEAAVGRQKYRSRVLLRMPRLQAIWLGLHGMCGSSECSLSSAGPLSFTSDFCSGSPAAIQGNTAEATSPPSEQSGFS